MRILIVSALALLLASCTLTPPANPGATITPPISTTSGSASDATTEMVATGGSIVTLNYTLRSDSETGKIEETTLQSVAEANGLAKSGATYQPFQVALGQNQVILGFEKGLMGVKK